MAAARGLSRSRSRAIGRLARPARLGGLTLALAAAAAAPAAAAPGVEVHLGARTAFLSAAQLAGQADVPATSYTLRGAPDDPGQVVTHAGVSVRRLLILAGANPDQVAFLEIPRADRGTAVLERGDYADPPPFPEGPALVWVDAEATHFFRPARDARDVNAADNIATTTGEALVVTARTGSLLTVTAHASLTKARAREPVDFTAAATGARPGERLRYRWSFDDGTVRAGARVRHAFDAEGRYVVAVTVTGDQDSAGAGPVIPVQVGAARKAKGKGAGGTNRDRRAPSSGPAKGPTSGGGSTTAAPSQPRSTGAGRPRSGTRSRSRSRSAPAGPRARPAPSSSAPRRAGTEVRGILLASSTPEATRRVLSSTAAARAAAKAGNPASGGHLEIPGVAVAASGLLLLGAGLELRRRPRAT
jgi:hypothetical protein